MSGSLPFGWGYQGQQSDPAASIPVDRQAMLRALQPMPTTSDPIAAGSPSLADGWTANANEYGIWAAKQRAAGVADGTLDPQTGWPTSKALTDAARQYGQALLGSTAAAGAKLPAGLVEAAGTKTATGDPVTAFMNPSRSDIARMLENTPGLHLRALQEGQNHAIWPALDATHGQMAAPLGFTKDAVLLDHRAQAGEPNEDFPQKAGRFSFWSASH